MKTVKPYFTTEEIMSIKSALTLIGFVSMIGVVHTSELFAEQGQRVDLSERIGHGGSTYFSSNSMPDGAVACRFTAQASGVDTIERIGHGGSLYSFSRDTSKDARDCNAANQRVSVVERIGHGGSTYSPEETMTN
jgi:hypothetical protein